MELLDYCKKNQSYIFRKMERTELSSHSQTRWSYYLPDSKSKSEKVKLMDWSQTYDTE